MSTKVNANAYMYFLELRLALLQAMHDGHSVVEFTHTWGGDSGYGDGSSPRMEIEFEVRITRINGDAVPRVKRSTTKPPKKGKP